ncbi:hypothetical protein [Polaribacter aestuariivivens]|uniref:hypothetical protein n=1 Tax=Polaribacter aestuariivivens TaxID=2304626 RepID=UPI003F49A193
MKGWSVKDVERVTGKKLILPKDKGLIPKPTPAGILFIKNHLTVLKIDFVQELVFSSKRKFRFDIAIPSLKLGIEYEGLNSAKSGHTTITGYTKDCTKYNLATKEGWRILRYTMINYKDFTKDIKEFIKK